MPVSGRVLDTQGNPVPDRILNFAPLRTLAGDGSEIGYSMECAGKEECTDVEGRFHLSGIAPLKSRITVIHIRDRFHQQPVNGEVFDLAAAANRTNLEIRIHPPQDYAISGHVYDGQGKPIRGMYVSTHNPLGVQWYAYSDDQGAFCLEGLDGLGKDTVDIHFPAPSGGVITRTGVPLHTKDLTITVP